MKISKLGNEKSFSQAIKFNQAQQIKTNARQNKLNKVNNDIRKLNEKIKTLENIKHKLEDTLNYESEIKYKLDHPLLNDKIIEAVAFHEYGTVYKINNQWCSISGRFKDDSQDTNNIIWGLVPLTLEDMEREI